MKILHFVYRRCCAGLITLTLCAAVLTGCSVEKQETQKSKQPDATKMEEKAAAKSSASGTFCVIKVSDTKKFAYVIPDGNGRSIDMTVTLHFIAWKEDSAEIFGQYEGRALVTFDMDLSKAGAGGVTYTGGVMNDSISDNISFELLPVQQETVRVKGEDIDLAPLVKFVGQAEILTDEYSISQQAWKAQADRQIKLDVNSAFGDGARNPQGFSLKVGKDTVLISIGDFAAAYHLDSFSGTISNADKRSEPLSWFRDKVMSRMEERLDMSGQSANQQTSTAAAPSEAVTQGGFTVDSEGREGMDINGDGRLEMYLDEDGEAWADFDGDGKYDIVGKDGTDMDER